MLTLAGVSLEQYAGVLAALAEGFTLTEVLAQERLPADAWPGAERVWREAIVESTELQISLLERRRVAEGCLRRPIKPLDEDAAAWIGFQGALALSDNPAALIARFRMTMGDVSRLGQAWKRRAQADPELAKELAELCGKSSMPTDIQAEKARLQPFPWTPAQEAPAVAPAAPEPKQEPTPESARQAGAQPVQRASFQIQSTPSGQASPDVARAAEIGSDQYAWIEASLQRAQPAEFDATLARFRLTRETYRDLRAHWQKRIVENPVVAASVRAAFERFTAAPAMLQVSMLQVSRPQVSMPQVAAAASASTSYEMRALSAEPTLPFVPQTAVQAPQPKREPRVFEAQSGLTEAEGVLSQETLPFEKARKPSAQSSVPVAQDEMPLDLYLQVLRLLDSDGDRASTLRRFLLSEQGWSATHSKWTARIEADAELKKKVEAKLARGRGDKNATPPSSEPRGNVFDLAGPSSSPQQMTSVAHPSAGVGPATPFVAGPVDPSMARRQASHQPERSIPTGTVPTSPTHSSVAVANVSGAEPLPGWTLERYAELCGDLDASQPRERVLANYGLSEATLRQIAKHWEATIAANPELRRRWLEASERRRARGGRG